MKDVVNNVKFLNYEFMEEKSEKNINDILIDIKGHVLTAKAYTSDFKVLWLKENFDLNDASMVEDKFLYQILFEAVRKFDNRIYLTFSFKDDEGRYTDDENFKRVYICIAKATENYYNDIELSKFEKILVMLQSTSRKELFKLAEGDEDLMLWQRR